MKKLLGVRGGDGQLGFVDVMAKQPQEFRCNATLRSISLVLKLLGPTLSSDEHDDAMINAVLSLRSFGDPLTAHEGIVLACALYLERQGQKTFGYTDVLILTDRFDDRPMNTTMVYKTFESLVERGLLDVKGREIHPKSERRVQMFAINERGRRAFRLTVLNLHYLSTSRRCAAA